MNLRHLWAMWPTCCSRNFGPRRPSKRLEGLLHAGAAYPIARPILVSIHYALHRLSVPPLHVSRSSPLATAVFPLLALAESAFDPLARTTRFYAHENRLTFCVGELVRRSYRAPHRPAHKESEDLRNVFGIYLPTIQKYLASGTRFALRPLVRSELFVDAASLRRRPEVARESFVVLRSPRARGCALQSRDTGARRREVPMRNAMTRGLRYANVEELASAASTNGTDLWESLGPLRKLTLPSRRFYRRIGFTRTFAATPRCQRGVARYFETNRRVAPSPRNQTYVRSLRRGRCSRRTRLPHWISPRPTASRGGPVDFGCEYVRSCEGFDVQSTANARGERIARFRGTAGIARPGPRSPFGLVERRDAPRGLYDGVLARVGSPEREL